MRVKNIVTAAAIALLPLAASAATFIVPAVGTGPGANDSRWQSEVKIHVTGASPVEVTAALHQGTSVILSPAVTIAPSTTLTLEDIVAQHFKSAGFGALEILVSDRDAKRIAVSSRTFNTLPLSGNELGQDVPAVALEDAAAAGDVVVLNGPTNPQKQRFNFGVYAAEATSITWTLVRANGSTAATKVVNYAAGEHVQHNSGVELLLGATAQNNDTVRASIESGRAVLYGSAVHNGSGDPTFVPAVRTRATTAITFIGIDVDENGTIDIADANEDGVLDAPLSVTTSSFPTIVRVVARTEFGDVVTVFEVVGVTNAADARVVDAFGTMMVGAGGDLKGKSGEIRLRAKDGAAQATFVIPVNFV